MHSRPCLFALQQDRPAANLWTAVGAFALQVSFPKKSQDPFCTLRRGDWSKAKRLASRSVSGFASSSEPSARYRHKTQEAPTDQIGEHQRRTQPPGLFRNAARVDLRGARCTNASLLCSRARSSNLTRNEPTHNKGGSAQSLTANAHTFETPPAPPVQRTEDISHADSHKRHHNDICILLLWKLP